MRLGRVRLSLLFWVEVGIGGGSEICGEVVWAWGAGSRGERRATRVVEGKDGGGG